jgi:hypothetical protein
MMNTLEWELRHVMAGSEIVIKNANGRPVVRGVLARDRATILGPMGQPLRIEWKRGWKMVIVRRKQSRAVSRR